LDYREAARSKPDWRELNWRMANAGGDGKIRMTIAPAHSPEVRLPQPTAASAHKIVEKRTKLDNRVLLPSSQALRQITPPSALRYHVAEIALRSQPGIAFGNEFVR
jgi:hypothetical protein